MLTDDKHNLLDYEALHSYHVNLLEGRMSGTLIFVTYGEYYTRITSIESHCVQYCVKKKGEARAQITVYFIQFGNTQLVEVK